MKGQDERERESESKRSHFGSRQLGDFLLGSPTHISASWSHLHTREYTLARFLEDLNKQHQGELCCSPGDVRSSLETVRLDPFIRREDLNQGLSEEASLLIAVHSLSQFPQAEGGSSP